MSTILTGMLSYEYRATTGVARRLSMYQHRPNVIVHTCSHFASQILRQHSRLTTPLRFQVLSLKMEHFLIWTPIIFPRGPNAPSGTTFCYSRSVYSIARPPYSSSFLPWKVSVSTVLCTITVYAACRVYRVTTGVREYGHCNIQYLLFELRKINCLACIINEESSGVDTIAHRTLSVHTCWSYLHWHWVLKPY